MLAVSLAALGGLIEAVGISSLLPLLSNDRQVIPGFSNIAVAAVLIASTLASSSSMRLLSDRAIARVVTLVEHKARTEFLERLMSSPWGRVSALPQGQATAAVMSEATQLSNGASAILAASSSAVIVAVLCVAAVWVTPLLFLIATVFMLLTFFIFAIRTKHVRRNEKLIQTATTDAGEKVSSVLTDLKYLRSTHAGDSWIRSARRNIDALRDLRFRQLVLPSTTRTLTDIAGAGFLGAVIVASLFVADAGTALVFVALFYRLIPRLQASQTALVTAAGQLEWLSEWDRRLLGLTSPANGTLAEGTSTFGGFKRTVSQSRPEAPNVKFEEVWFRHSGSAEFVLRGASLDLRGGSVVALVGESGAGKTTILDLLLGLTEPDRGSVTVDGVAIPHWPRSAYRDLIGFVPQDVRLRRGTIAENIAWVEDPQDDRLALALGLSLLEGWVHSLPSGVATHLEATGAGLSGGQRQRIGLARALYHRPSLLVLDEATSALDAATERGVVDSLKRLPWPVTCLLVTHRPSVLAEVDEVLKLENGTINRIGGKA